MYFCKKVFSCDLFINGFLINMSWKLVFCFFKASPCIFLISAWTIYFLQNTCQWHVLFLSRHHCDMYWFCRMTHIRLCCYCDTRCFCMICFDQSIHHIKKYVIPTAQNRNFLACLFNNKRLSCRKRCLLFQPGGWSAYWPRQKEKIVD